MDEYEQVIAEIVKHGVVVDVNKIVDDNYMNYERKYVGCVVKLDFSEHDKVFEDKIAELENIINHKLGGWDKHGITYQEILDMKSENQELKQRIAELESENKQLKHDIDKMATSKSEWIDKAVEWQQKCEKLESRETGKQTKCTAVIVAKEINGQVYVTLDDFMSVVNDF